MAPAMMRLGTLAGRMEPESSYVPNPTASARAVRPRVPGPRPARSASASTMGISSVIRPMLDGMTKASA